MEEEEKITGKVGFIDYRNYLSYSMGCFGIVLYFVCCILAAILSLAVSLFLTEWAS